MANLLLAAMQPPKALANQANQPQAANPTVSPTALEPEILSEINRVRTNPQGYAQWLEEQQQYYDGIWLSLPGEKPVRTNKGRKALEEAIAILKTKQPLPPLSISEQTAATATSKLEDFATANNIQYISYGRVTAEGIVMGLVVDDLFPDRRRRNNLLNPDVENTGVVCKPDPRYARVCAIAYSDTTTVDIAEAEPSSTQEVAIATPNSEISEPQADLPATDTTPPVETTPTPPSPQNNTTNADLPQPSPPQVPPVLPTPSEPVEEVEVEPPQEVEVSQADEEVEIEEVEVEAPEEVEISQTEEDAEIEPAQTQSEEVEVEEVEVEPPQEVEVSQADEEVEVEPAETDEELEFESEETQAEESEVAANSVVTDLLERIERGSLEQGDRVISDDGSFYDSYPIEGKAGESFNIYLESDEFDAFVALIDANGNIVEQNDDISQEDSNSRIRVTLPEDGIYNVIVNTYDEGGTGKYVLTVSR